MVTNPMVEGGTGLRFLSSNQMPSFCVGGQFNVGAIRPAATYDRTFPSPQNYF